MKRSIHLQSKAKHAALKAAMILAATVCAGVWSVRVAMDSMALGVICYLITLTGLFYFLGMVRDALHFAAEANRAAMVEWETRPIPRI